MPMIESEMIYIEDQKNYWLGVGISLYLTNPSRPVIANTIRNNKKPMIVQILQPLTSYYV